MRLGKYGHAILSKFRDEKSDGKIYLQEPHNSGSVTCFAFTWDTAPEAEYNMVGVISFANRFEEIEFLSNPSFPHRIEFNPQRALFKAFNARQDVVN